MVAQKNDKQIYIVITQTGTVLSRLLKGITGAEYNHASISLSPDLTSMYSFGRRNPYNPFFGGFVHESRHFGTFKRFKNTKAIVLAVDISKEKHDRICDMINGMLQERRKYHYNYIGLCLAAFKIIHKRRNRYYCSEFVAEVLKKHEIAGAEQLSEIVHPTHFLNLQYTQVYCGKLQDYDI